MKNNHHHKGRSISHDLMIGLMSTVVIVSTIAVSLSYYFSYKNAAEQLQIKADEISASLSQTLSVPLWNFDDETVKNIGSSYIQNEIVSHLEIVNTTGDLIFGFDRQEADHDVERSGKIYQHSDTAGSFSLALSSGHYNAVAFTFLWRSILLILLILIALLCMIKLLMVYVLEFRINQFSKMVGRFKDSSYSLPDNFVPVHEFKVFFSVLFEMGEQIKKQMKELKKSQNELEIRVQERTEELRAEVIERKQTEIELRESELMNRSLLEGSPICNKIIDLDGKLRYMSTAGQNYLKIPDIEPYYGQVYPPELYPESVRAPMVNGFKRALAGEIIRIEAPLNNMEGNEMWFDTTFVPALDDDGQVQHVIASSIDITERKRADAELRNYAKTQTVLLREVNHRVKNNLTSIIGMLHKEEDRAAEEGLTEYIPRLQETVERIQGLLAVHSILSKSGWQPLPLNKLCEEIILNTFYGSPNPQAISCEVTTSNILVTSDQAHNLTLVLNELATNTIKYALSDKRTVKVHVSIHQQDDSITLDYHDDGPGFPDFALDGEFPSTCIGFHLIVGLVKTSLQGKIELINHNGAMVKITFPAMTSEAENKIINYE